MEITDFDRCLADLAVELRRLPLPSPVVIPAARWLASEAVYNYRTLPDWAAALANGSDDPDLFPALIQTVREELEAEPESPVPHGRRAGVRGKP